MMSQAADFWLTDVWLAGQWKPVPGYERTADHARGRADAVHHWAQVRVRNAVTGETWQRRAGDGWALVDATPVAAPPPDAPRRPIRHVAHEVERPANRWWMDRDD